MSEDIQRLMVRLEANSSKMISETKKASAAVAEAMRRIDGEFAKSNRRVTDGLTRKGKQLQENVGNYRNVGFAAQNAAFQVGDFFTQVAGGTAPTRALAQQLPQLLGGLGLFGALAGAAAAALVPLAGNLLSAGGAGETAEKAVQSLGASMEEYQRYIQVAAMTTSELTAKFGEFAGQVRAFSEYMAGVALAETLGGLQATVTAVKGELTSVTELAATMAMLQSRLDETRVAETQGLAGLEDVMLAQEALAVVEEQANSAAAAMGLTVDQAVKFAAAIDAVGQAKSMEEIALASGEALAILQAMVPIGYELPAPLREAAAALEEMQRRAAEANVDLSEMPGILSAVVGAAESAASAVGAIGGAAEGAYGAVAALATKLWEAAQAKAAAALAVENDTGGMAAQYAQYGQGRVIGERLSRESGSLYGGQSVLPPARGGRAGGGAGGGSDIAAEAKRIYDETRTAAEKYRVEEARLGELLRANAITQDTYGRAIEGLKDKYKETGNSLQEFQDAFRSGFSDMISGVIDGSMKAEDAVRKMVTRLASMLIESQIFSLLGKLMPNVFGAGGFLPLTKSAMGNVVQGGRMQAFAAGGVVNGPTMFPMRGGTGLMGEAGPEAIMPLTRVNGKLGVQASGGSGGPRTVVQVINQGGGEVRQERQQGPGGEELIRITVGKQLARGDHDSAMKRYAARPAGVKR